MAEEPYIAALAIRTADATAAELAPVRGPLYANLRIDKRDGPSVQILITRGPSALLSAELALLPSRAGKRSRLFAKRCSAKSGASPKGGT